MTCKVCGKKYNKWTTTTQALKDGFCNHCFSNATKAEVEMQASSLQSLAKSIIPDQSFSCTGMAYWNDIKTTARTGITRLAFSAFLSSIFLSRDFAGHRVGVMCLGGKNLYVIDCGEVIGENISPKEFKEALILEKLAGKKPIVKSAPLDKLTADYDEKKGILRIDGAIKIKAHFPNCYSETNAAKAIIIAKTIQAVQH